MSKVSELKMVEYTRSYEANGSYFPKSLVEADQQILDATLQQVPLWGVELEYDCNNEYDAEILQHEIALACAKANLPYLFCGDGSLENDEAFECNLAPATFRQLLVFFKELFSADYLDEVRNNSLHSCTGMHIHLSHNFLLEYRKSIKLLPNHASWFNSLDACFLFAYICNSRDINSSKTDLFNRDWQSYSERVCFSVFSRYLDKFRNVSNYSFDTFTSEKNAADVSSLFMELGTGMARIKTNTIEWRPFKTPETLPDAVTALAMVIIYTNFSNKYTEILREPPAVIVNTFNKYFRLRLPKYTRLINSLISSL